MEALPDTLFARVCSSLSLLHKVGALSHVSRSLSRLLLQPLCYSHDELCVRFPRADCDEDEDDNDDDDPEDETAETADSPHVHATESATAPLCRAHAVEAVRIRSVQCWLPRVRHVHWTYGSAVSAACAPHLQPLVADTLRLMMQSNALRRLTLWESPQRELSVLVSFCAALQAGSCPVLEELDMTFDDDDIRDERDERRITYEAAQWSNLRHVRSLRRFVWTATLWTSDLVPYRDLLAGLPVGLRQLELRIALYDHQAEEDVPGVWAIAAALRDKHWLPHLELVLCKRSDVVSALVETTMVVTQQTRPVTRLQSVLTSEPRALLQLTGLEVLDVELDGTLVTAFARPPASAASGLSLSNLRKVRLHLLGHTEDLAPVIELLALCPLQTLSLQADSVAPLTQCAVRGLAAMHSLQRLLLWLDGDQQALLAEVRADSPLVPGSWPLLSELSVRATARLLRFGELEAMLIASPVLAQLDVALHDVEGYSPVSAVLVVSRYCQQLLILRLDWNDRSSRSPSHTRTEMMAALITSGAHARWQLPLLVHLTLPLSTEPSCLHLLLSSADAPSLSYLCWSGNGCRSSTLFHYLQHGLPSLAMLDRLSGAAAALYVECESSPGRSLHFLDPATSSRTDWSRRSPPPISFLLDDCSSEQLVDECCIRRRFAGQERFKSGQLNGRGEFFRCLQEKLSPHERAVLDSWDRGEYCDAPHDDACTVYHPL